MSLRWFNPEFVNTGRAVTPEVEGAEANIIGG
jgi:hypothetical protein